MPGVSCCLFLGKLTSTKHADHCIALFLDGNPSVVPPLLLQVSYVLAFTTGYAVTQNHTPAIPGSSVPFDTSLFSAGEVLLEVAI